MIRQEAFDQESEDGHEATSCLQRLFAPPIALVFAGERIGSK